MPDPCNARLLQRTRTCRSRARLRPAAEALRTARRCRIRTGFDRLAPSATAANRHLLLCIVEPRRRHGRRVGRAGGLSEPPQIARLRRHLGPGACGLAAAVVLTGCSAGQVSQTAIQEPAVNGTNAVAGDPVSGIALRNVHLRAPQTVDYVRPGSKVELLFVAVNESRRRSDRLVSITSDVGTVALTGDTDAASRRHAGRRHTRRPAQPARRHRGRRHRRGRGHADQADQQRPDLRLHVHVRAVRCRRPSRCRSRRARPRAATTKGAADGARRDTGGHALARCAVLSVRDGYRRLRGSSGSKARSQYRCSECGHVTAKWVGRCPDCGTWGTVNEVAVLTALGGPRRAPRGRTHLARRTHQLDRPGRHAPLPHRHQRTGPRAGRRPGTRLGDAAGRRSRRRQVDAAARGRPPLGADRAPRALPLG